MEVFQGEIEQRRCNKGQKNHSEQEKDRRFGNAVAPRAKHLSLSTERQKKKERNNNLKRVAALQNLLSSDTRGQHNVFLLVSSYFFTIFGASTPAVLGFKPPHIRPSTGGSFSLIYFLWSRISGCRGRERNPVQLGNHRNGNGRVGRVSVDRVRGWPARQLNCSGRRVING